MCTLVHWTKKKFNSELLLLSSVVLLLLLLRLLHCNNGKMLKHLNTLWYNWYYDKNNTNNNHRTNKRQKGEGTEQINSSGFCIVCVCVCEYYDCWELLQFPLEHHLMLFGRFYYSFQLNTFILKLICYIEKSRTYSSSLIHQRGKTKTLTIFFWIFQTNDDVWLKKRIPSESYWGNLVFVKFLASDILKCSSRNWSAAGCEMLGVAWKPMIKDSSCSIWAIISYFPIQTECPWSMSLLISRLPLPFWDLIARQQRNRPKLFRCVFW